MYKKKPVGLAVNGGQSAFTGQYQSIFIMLHNMKQQTMVSHFAFLKYSFCSTEYCKIQETLNASEVR
jgi:hypothetical protein